jgi:hypothetical protein
MKRAAAWTFLSAGLLAGCGADSPASVESPSTPVTATSAVATPTPAPSPTPTPSNLPPSVTVRGGGECHPQRSTSGRVSPCTVVFEADATDPERDSLTFEWSGCASGSEREARCTIDAPGAFEATVRVRDGHGGSATARGAARGTNAPPVLKVGYLPENPHIGSDATVLGWVSDEDGSCGGSYCGGGRASGACEGSRVVMDCTCLGDVQIDVHPTSLGTCRLDIDLVDPWGLRGTTTVTFDVR